MASIPGFPGYTKKNGSVYGPNGKKLSPRKDKDGYLRVDLRKGGKRYTRFMHTIMNGLKHKSKAETDHKNGDRTDNRPSNLETVNHGENMKRMGARQKKK